MLINALKKVFKKPSYILLALVSMFLVFAVSVWLPNIPLIIKIMGHGGITFNQKVGIPVSLLGSIYTNFTLISAIYTIFISLFFGINLAMFVFFLKRKINTLQKSGMTTGFLGLLSGIVGVGCAACGSLVLASLLSLFGSTWIITLLPLKGEEFGILGVILLMISIYMVAKQIEDPAVCSI